MFDLKPDRPVAALDAATVILVRDGEGGLEVFCVERSKKSRFLGGAVVFPGGRLDASDAADAWRALTTPPRAPASSGAFSTDEAHLRALAVAAARETLEEAAMLHVTGGEGVTQGELLALRSRLDAEASALRAFLGERGLLLDLAALYPLARWITPEAEARRFDTRFFVAAAPRGQVGSHDSHETMASFWATPAEVIRRWAEGEVQVAPPTHATLALLSGCPDAGAALALSASSCLDPILPGVVRHADAAGETLALTLPGDPEHEVREARVPGPSRYVLRGDRWQPEGAPR